MSKRPEDLERIRSRDRADQKTYQELCSIAKSTIATREDELSRLLRIESMRAQNSAQSAASVFGMGYMGYGNGWTDAHPRILYPKERKRARRHLPEIRFSRTDLRAASERDEILVPMRLDLDYDRYKLRDTFTMNLNDGAFPIDLFAEHLCEDYGLPQVGFATDIQKSMKAQLADYHPHKFIKAQPDNIKESNQVYVHSKDDDLRISIKIDITVGTLNLTDQIEWDINNSLNDAESFAESFCTEFGLQGDFRTAISHMIREQCQMYTKSLFLVGHTFDGSEVQDSDIRQLILPVIQGTLRPKHQLDSFAPVLNELSMEQVEKVEREREREGRRNRRQTRGKRGAILPDLHDLPKTFRTPYGNAVLSPDGCKFVDVDQVPGHEDVEIEPDLDDLQLQLLPDSQNKSEKHLRSNRSFRSNEQDSALDRSFPAAGRLQSGTPQTTKSLSSLPSVSRPFEFYSQDPNNSQTDSGQPGAKHLQDRPHIYGEESMVLTNATADQGTYVGAMSRKSTVSPAPSQLLIFKFPIHKLAAKQRQGGLAQQFTPLKNVRNVTGSRDSQPESSLSLVPASHQTRLRTLHENFPADRFEPVIKHNSNVTDETPAVRIRCLSCPGVLYYIEEFEVHLRNRVHRSRREQQQSAP